MALHPSSVSNPCAVWSPTTVRPGFRGARYVAVCVALLLLVSAGVADAFSSSSGSCYGAGAQAFHGPSSVGTGGFAFTATLDGQPATLVYAGETVVLTLSRAAGYKGFLVSVHEGVAGGPFVGGLAVTAESQKLMDNCPTPSATATQTSSLTRVSDVLEWTVPEGLVPGTDVVVSAFPVVSTYEWYGAAGEPIQQILTVAAAPTPVPVMGPLMHGALVGLLAVSALVRRRFGNVLS